jgi:hypothetical protein
MHSDAMLSGQFPGLLGMDVRLLDGFQARLNEMKEMSWIEWA